MRTCCAGMLLALAAARVASAQTDVQPRMAPQLFADVVRLYEREGVEAGGGVQIPMGYYTRIGVTAAGGVVASEASGRVDLVARFLFDPFRQQRWGLSAGGGVSFRVRAHDHGRPYLLAVIDLEGPYSARGISPALQLGLGGGIRLGAGLRWGARGAR